VFTTLSKNSEILLSLIMSRRPELYKDYRVIIGKTCSRSIFFTILKMLKFMLPKSSRLDWFFLMVSSNTLIDVPRLSFFLFSDYSFSSSPSKAYSEGWYSNGLLNTFESLSVYISLRTEPTSENSFIH
jgi:hypothetical protein